jgi:phosphate:Na+ symporter
MIIFSSKRKFHYSAIFIFGFGLLLFGINFMRESFGFIDAGFSLESYLNLHRYLYIFIGLGITALVQSTAICNTITFTAVSSGLISFEVGLIMII